ncbi:hypothetical protein GQX73_g10391 [Xylaria multiplex]|uniref:Uncharacterized protein n=1 Tax=Xylaria multiplex TaxID=323545 RepID=A0A7C8MKW6_9PEZI|nr:hypothetical protein GQX73_g10391 [Xylaria multiplex]
MGLKSLKSKYHDAPLVISTIIGQLYIVQSALDELAIWNKRDDGRERDPRYRDLASQIDNGLDCFRLLILALDQRLNDFELNGIKDMTTRQRLTFLWNERETSDYSVLLDRQVNALNLLLQAVQWYAMASVIFFSLFKIYNGVKSLIDNLRGLVNNDGSNNFAQQQDLLLREESRLVLQQAKDCSSSISGLGDSASFISETTTRISLVFDFDAIILASKVYQQAGRSHPRQAIGARQLRLKNQAPTQEQSKQGSQEDFFQPIGPPRPAPLPPIGGSSKAPPRETQNVVAIKSLNDNLPPISAVYKTSPGKIPQHKFGDPISSTSLSPSSPTLTDLIRIPSPTKSQMVGPTMKIMVPAVPHSPPKFLILGSSESGKSTLLKGLKLATVGGWTQEEKLSFSTVIWSATVNSIRHTLKAMESLDIPLQNPTNEEHIHTISVLPVVTGTTPTPNVVNAISGLRLDEGFQIAYNRRNEYHNHIRDSLAYYAENIQRLVLPHYVPTNEDMLWANLKTIGITETWLTSYARLLFEDDTVNRMKEQLALFYSIVNSQWFPESGFVLIFTKIDLLREWLWRYPVGNHFPDYPQNRWPAAESVERYMQYLTGKFLETVQSIETAARIRIVQGDLVCDSKDTVPKVLNAINSLAAIYPDLNGLSRSESSAS